MLIRQFETLPRKRLKCVYLSLLCSSTPCISAELQGSVSNLFLFWFSNTWVARGFGGPLFWDWKLFWSRVAENKPKIDFVQWYQGGVFLGQNLTRKRFKGVPEPRNASLYPKNVLFCQECFFLRRPHGTATVGSLCYSHLKLHGESNGSSPGARGGFILP